MYSFPDNPNPNLAQHHAALGFAMFKAGVIMEPDVAYRIVAHLYDEYGQQRVAEDIMHDKPDQVAA